jgi:hypothetical protein
MNVTSAEFEALTEAAHPDWILRVTIRGEFEQEALPIVAEVGAVPVEALMQTFEEPGLQGFLSAEPDEGDELRIGRIDEPLEGTDITYTPPGGGVA